MLDCIATERGDMLRYYSFAGTIQAFVPHEKLEVFKTGMETLLGAGKCHILHIRPQGGCVIVE